MQDLNKPKQVAIVDKHNYMNVVQVNKKYQCPTYCDVNHHHSVYFNGESSGMIIEKSNLGKMTTSKGG